jgi:hypothetical protein
MTRSVLLGVLFAACLFLGDWFCGQVRGSDCGCGAGPSSIAGGYDTIPCGDGSCGGGCGDCGGYSESCTGCCDESCGACGNLRSLGRGFWGRLAAGGCSSDSADCGCGDGCGLSSCNYGHACDLFSRFTGGGACGAGGCGTGLFGRCGACSGPGAGDPTGRTVRYCGMPSPAYPVPYSVPAYVGITHLTYPPMMPHHSLPHYRGTYSYRHDQGLSRTTVHWRKTHIINAASFLHHVIELPR